MPRAGARRSKTESAASFVAAASLASRSVLAWLACSANHFRVCSHVPKGSVQT